MTRRTSARTLDTLPLFAAPVGSRAAHLAGDECKTDGWEARGVVEWHRARLI